MKYVTLPEVRTKGCPQRLCADGLRLYPHDLMQFVLP